MNRRELIKSAAATVVGSLLTGFGPGRGPARLPAGLDRIGVGLFTMPYLLEHNFAAAMKKLGDIGYREVELFGPYPYSVPEARAAWAPVAETLGLSQSGYYGQSPQQVRKILDDNGISSPSMHIDLKTLQTRLDDVAEAADVLGQRYAGIAAIPADQRQSLDDYKRIADEFNEVGLRMGEVDLKFLYHNHGYGLVEMDGEIPFQVLIERTDPDVVALEMDVYWMTAGRADPVEYLRAYPGRFQLMHIKDMSELVHFAGDGGDPSQWIELFPHMTDAGSGVLDLAAILSQAHASGVEHFLLERDLAPDLDKTLEDSYRFLASVEIED